MNNEVGIVSKKICTKIKFERLKRNFTQEQLGELSGISTNAIGKIERGESSPTILTLEKIASAFDINFLELVDVSKVEL